MNESDVELRLDEDFLFILKFAKDHLNVFIDEPELHSLTQLWLNKLCTEVVEGLTAKRARNTYLVRLVSCMQSEKITAPFDVPPKPGPLRPLPLIEDIEPEPPWLEELIQEAKEQQLGRGHAKDARTYLATKVFDANKGACAYLAVSVADEGNIPAWVRMGTPKEEREFERHLDSVFKRIAGSIPKTSTPRPQQQNQAPTAKRKLPTKHEEEEMELNKEMALYIAYQIQMELSGKGAAKNAQIEEMLNNFMASIQNTSLGESAASLSGADLRKFLLTQVHAALINEIEYYK